MIEATEGTCFYFAYGSNMCTRKLQGISGCPSATVLAVARLPRHELQFRMGGKKQKGSCAVNAWDTGREESAVWGVLFRITDEERKALIRVEGPEGWGYVPTDVAVFPRGSDRSVTALVMMVKSADVNPAGRPFDWYLRYCLEGAWQNDLPADYISKSIMSQEFVRDPNDKQRSDHIRFGC